jgi:flavin-dependent dehydrogenase
LIDNARRKGAVVREQTVARRLLLDGDTVLGVEANAADGSTRHFTSPVTIDASGRDAFALNQYDWKVRDQNLQKISIWTYVRAAMRDSGLDSGATTIAYLPHKGWFWYIPLPDDVVSVGIVAERDYLYRTGRNPEAIFQREVAVNDWIKRHLAPGTIMGPYRVTGDYSYRSRCCAANGLVLTGDALGFLDPVFSSGVLLALRGGELAGDAVHEALRDGDVTATRFAAYGRTMHTGIEAMRKLICAFYDETFSFGELLRKHPRVRADLTDCLIGNLFRNFDSLFEAVGEFACLPPTPNP